MCSLPVRFNDTVTTAFPIVSWEWDFGDGFTSTQAGPDHTYANTGRMMYNSIIVTNTQGCSDTLLKTEFIKAGKKPNLAFDVDTNRVCALAPYSLSMSPREPIATYGILEMGDTAMSTNPSHGFGALGVLGVTLIGFDRGCPDTLAKPDYVEALAPLPIMGISQKRVCELPSEVLVQNLSIQDTYWSWIVDSTYTYNTRHFTHTFLTSGDHEITLIVGNTQTGCEIEATDYVQAYPIEPDIVLDTTRGCVPVKIDFINNTPNINGRIWYFGNGDSVTTANASYVYKTPGDYPGSVLLRNFINVKIRLT